MKKTANLLLILFSFIFLQSCEDEQFDASAFDYVGFESSSYTAGVDVGGTTTVTIPVYASKAGTATVSVSVDGSGAGAGSYDVPTSVSIPSGSNEGTLTVTLSDSNLGIGVNRLVISFGDDLTSSTSSGGSTTISYTQNCAEVTATLDFSFDYWSSETSWDIKDSLGGVVVSGGGYVDGQGTASETITLCQGRSYTLTVYDAFEDGMNDGVNPLGSYTLTIGGVTKATGGGLFGASETNAFDTL